MNDQTVVLRVFDAMAALFVLALGLILLALVVVYLADVTQTKQALRRNFPVIVHCRYLLEKLGEFFRQYFFAMDREEMPFNRAQRAWVYRAAKNLDNTVAFGSTRDLRPPGTVLFVNTPFPTLDDDAVPPHPVTLGANCAHPYTTASIFNISAMSYGAISRPAVLALSKGAKAAGCWLNTGEGGLSPAHLEGGADLIFQIGTAKNGVRNLDGALDDRQLAAVAAHPQVKMFEVKLSQGAKPGKGGILPGAKVTPEIAAIRHIRVGVDAISPNRHPDVRDNDSLLDLVCRIRHVTGKPVGIKAVLGSADWLDALFARIRARGVDCAPDFFTLDGAEGGTGAAPQGLIDDMGLPLREALPMLIDKLDEYGLRDTVRVIAAGKLITAADVAWALAVGADFVNSARGFMFALGCIQSLHCNRNTCPTGITTHNPRLQKGLVPAEKAERVAHYHANLTREVGIIAHACGVPEPRLLGREHCRMVLASGRSESLATLYPHAGQRLPDDKKIGSRTLVRDPIPTPWISIHRIPIRPVPPPPDRAPCDQPVAGCGS